MISALVVSQVITWLLLIAVVVALLALARQVGVLYERIAPAGALTPKHGPEVGSRSPRVMSQTLDGAAFEIGGALPEASRRMIFFVSASCPVCKKLLPFVKSFARAENVDLVFAGDDRPEKQRDLVKSAELGAYPFLNDPTVGRAFGIDKLPHAVLLAADGTILSRGLVNSREHFESMVIAAETGVRSVQEYIEARASAGAH